MAYKIAIASGKGGTGKTTVSVNLFMQLNEILGGGVQLVDCDVEEPNDVIFFDDSEKISEKEISQLIPAIDNDKCTFCRKCAEYCEFNAIVVIPPVKFAEANSSLCHSCGACLIACQHNAITEYEEAIGTVNAYKTKEDYDVTEGRLKIGSAMQTMLIKELKKQIPDTNDIILYDAPPGTSCPVVETISDANYVILVAEPTLFGVHDLKLMVRLLKELAIPFGIIINKAGLGDQSIYHYIEKEGIDLLGEIPFSKGYASLYAKGEITRSVPKEIKEGYKKVLNVLNQQVLQYEGDNYFKW